MNTYLTKKGCGDMGNKYEFESLRLGFRHWKEEDKIPFARMNASVQVMEYFTSVLTSEQSDVMKKIGLQEKGTFNHPRIEEGNPLRLHVLYKIDKETYDKI